MHKTCIRWRRVRDIHVHFHVWKCMYACMMIIQLNLYANLNSVSIHALLYNYVYYSYTHLWQELVYPWMHQSLLVPLTSYSHDFWGHRGNFWVSCWHFLLWFVLHLLDKNKKKLKYRDSLVAHSMSYNVYINRSILSRKAQCKCTVHNLYLSKLSLRKYSALLKRHKNLSCLSNSNFVFCKDFNYTFMREGNIEIFPKTQCLSVRYLELQGLGPVGFWTVPVGTGSTAAGGRGGYCSQHVRANS